MKIVLSYVEDDEDLFLDLAIRIDGQDFYLGTRLASYYAKLPSNWDFI